MNNQTNNVPQPESEQQKGKNSLTRYGAIALVLAMAFLAAVFIWFMASHADEFIDTAAQPGQASYKSEEEIRAELNRIVEEGMLNISIASVIEFDNGTSPGVAYIENVPSNKYIMRVAISLDDTGETVYESGGMLPNTHIDTITLSKPLAAGSYPATALFKAYNPDTLDEVGQAAAKIVISVAA